MEIMQIVGIGLLAAFIAVILKPVKPEISIQVSIAAGIIIFIMLIGKISSVVKLLETYNKKANIDMVYFSTLLKIVGIAYIAEFAAEICKDAGESAIASKIELGGKVIIVVLAIPIVTSLLDLIIDIMP